jgi:predicted outer membrane repeat protein
MSNLCLPVWGLLSVFAVLLAPTEAWEASTSQNLSITVTPIPTTTNAFYIATNGSDSNPGTLAAPFATVQACQTAMRAQPATGTKTCYIRAGTYSGSGHGYNMQTSSSSWTISAMLILTASDSGTASNPTTYAIYPSDFPSNGISTAIFDGGATGWTACCGFDNGTGCTVNANPTTAAGWGFYVNGANYVTINGLQFQNVCYGGLAANNGPTGNHSQNCMNNNANTTSTNIVFANNTIHNTSSASARCSGDAQANVAPIAIEGSVQSSSISHNLVYNSPADGIRASANVSGTAESFANLTIDHNFVYNTSSGQCDGGAIYTQDPGEVSTNVLLNANYVLNYGAIGNGFPGCSGSGPNGGNFAADNGGANVAFYGDDGESNTTWQYNVAVGYGFMCYNIHAGTNNVEQYNICDGANPGTANIYGASDNTQQYFLRTQNSGVAASGTASMHQNIDIGKATSCPDNYCTIDNSWSGTLTVGANAYYNYGSGGAGLFTTSAGGTGEGTSTTVANMFNTCPGGSLNSWGYVINAGNAVFGSPTNYPAQPSGWATPGFWGPTGYVIPHSITSTVDGNSHTPSYGPTC